MLYSKIARRDAEKCYIVVKNVSGSTITAGYHVTFDVSTNVDGVRVTQASSFDLGCYAGCVDKDLVNNGYGLVQIFGFRSAAYVCTSGATVSGEKLVPTADVWSLAAGGLSTGTAAPFAILCQAVASAASSTSVNKKIFIRAI